MLVAAEMGFKLPSIDEMRAEILGQRIRLDRAGFRLDPATTAADRAAARIGLDNGTRWLASPEAQLAKVDI